MKKSYLILSLVVLVLGISIPLICLAKANSSLSSLFVSDDEDYEIAKPLDGDTSVVPYDADDTAFGLVEVVEEPDPLEKFQIEEISDELFKRMYGKSFKENCTVPREDLRYLTIPHYTLEGDVVMGEMVVNKAIADDIIDIFKTLFNAKYPIERMVLIDDYNADDRASMSANNTSSFNFRVVAGSKNLSKHAYGMAVDVNPRYNPYVKNGKNGLYVSPKNGTEYADRSKNFPYKIDTEDLCYKEFIKHGFIWGGAWNSMKDYQHFEKDLKYLKN